MFFLLQNLVTANFDECGPSQIQLKKVESKQQSLAGDCNTQEKDTRRRLHEDLDCAQSDDDDDDDDEEESSIVFNGDLRCEHGL